VGDARVQRRHRVPLQLVAEHRLVVLVGERNDLRLEARFAHLDGDVLAVAGRVPRPSLRVDHHFARVGALHRPLGGDARAVPAHRRRRAVRLDERHDDPRRVEAILERQEEHAVRADAVGAVAVSFRERRPVRDVVAGVDDDEVVPGPVVLLVAYVAVAVHSSSFARCGRRSVGPRSRLQFAVIVLDAVGRVPVIVLESSGR